MSVKKRVKWPLVSIVLIPILFVGFIIFTVVDTYYRNPEALNKMALSSPAWMIIRDFMHQNFSRPGSHKELEGYKVGDQVFYLPRGFSKIYQDTYCDALKSPEDESNCYKGPEKLSFYLAMPDKETTFANAMDVEILALDKKQFGTNIDVFFQIQLKSFYSRNAKVSLPLQNGKFFHYEVDWGYGIWDIFITKDENGKIRNYINCTRFYGYGKDTEIASCREYVIFSEQVYFTYLFKYEYINEFERLGEYVKKYLIKITDKNRKI